LEQTKFVAAGTGFTVGREMNIPEVYLKILLRSQSSFNQFAANFMTINFGCFGFAVFNLRHDFWCYFASGGQTVTRGST